MLRSLTGRVLLQLARPQFCTKLKMSQSLHTRYLAEEQTPYSRLEAKPFFDTLSDKEKHYAHYMARASFAGTRVILETTNPAAVKIYDLILKIFTGDDGAMVDVACLEKDSGVSQESFEQFMQYCGQFLGNLSNYKSFGDEKFVPRLAAAEFQKIAAARGCADAFTKVQDEIYGIEPAARNLIGYPEDGHLSGYYSSNVTKADIANVQAFLDKNSINALNTRLFKDDSGSFRLLVASAVEDSKDLDMDGTPLKLIYGDFKAEMAKAAENVAKAKRYAANEHQQKMLDAYHESFITGSIEAHMDSQRHWLHDIGPAVETNLGFIETYRDPHGVRAEWEGFVAMVNKEQTRKFANLVDRAPQFVSRLPWSKEFERQTINKPDFTSLEVLAFATSGVPAGINIPNYQNITQVLGSKNVSLGNVISAQAPNEKFPFIAPEDLELYRKYRNPSFEVQVGTHELGHGTGKLFEQDADGRLNFDQEKTINPLTNTPVQTWYKPGQTFNSLFEAVSSSYEECRAECIALTLGHHTDILETFGYTDQEAENVLYVMYLNMARAGLVGLEFYDMSAKKWGQAHVQARYAIFRTMLNAGHGFLTLERTGEAGLELRMDRSKIRSVGAPAVADLLSKLQVYKATADAENGVRFYLEATSVPEEWNEIRDIVIKNKQPRKQFVQGNTLIEDGKVVLREYEPSAKGMIQSFVERENLE